MKHRARTCCRESLWREADTFSQSELRGDLRQWLLDDGSLTRRLRALCPGRFRVRILHQGWDTPLINEAQHLGIRLHQRVFRREVVLYCAERAMVYARTVIPARTLKGRLSRLAKLGEKPLGEILFTDPHIQRREFEIARLQPGELLFSEALEAMAAAQRVIPAQPSPINTIWARRSTFAYHNKRLLVSEIFLPHAEFGYGTNPVITRNVT